MVDGTVKKKKYKKKKIGSGNKMDGKILRTYTAENIIIDSNSLPTHFKNFMPSLTFKNLNKDYPYHT